MQERQGKSGKLREREEKERESEGKFQFSVWRERTRKSGSCENVGLGEESLSDLQVIKVYSGDYQLRSEMIWCFAAHQISHRMVDFFLKTTKTYKYATCVKLLLG